jgi:hypothetical protein
MRKSSIFRKVLVAFGSIFSNISIDRYSEAGKRQTIIVPCEHGPKEKWITRIDGDPTLENQTAITLPRLAYQLTGIEYDSLRKTGVSGQISCPSPDGTKKFTFAGAPYILDITLSLLTKNQEDGFQVLEQILSKFNPENTITIKNIEEVNIQTQVPIALTSVSINDEFEGDFQTRRLITWELNFSCKIMVYQKALDGFVVKAEESSDSGYISSSAGVDIHMKDMLNKPSELCEEAIRVIKVEDVSSQLKHNYDLSKTVNAK